jgi:hypothetical protein
VIPKTLATRMTRNIIVNNRTSPRSTLARAIIKYRLATDHEGTLPSFIIIGTQRGGTTNLYHLLQGHPNVYPSLVKEVHYFDRHFDRGPAWYLAHFGADCRTTDDSDLKPITGEATPCYIFHPHAARRISTMLPTTKCIVLLRNPVDRAYSHYGLARKWAYEDLSFEEAIDREQERIGDDDRRMREDDSYFGVARARYSYLARGIYANQLPSWFEHFDSSQMLILQSETFFDNPASTLNRVIDFLGLEPMTLSTDYQYPTVARSPLNDATHANLVEFFKPHNERLYNLIGTEYDWE